MQKVNLKNYPRFWADFTERINDTIDPSAHVSAALVKLYIKDWYDIDVHIMQFGLFGEVYMLGKDYTAFAIKWG